MKVHYKLADFLALNISVNEYQKETIEKANKLAEEVSQFYPATMMVEVYKDEDNSLYYEHPHVFLDLPNLDYMVCVSYNYDKKYRIYAYSGFGHMDYITTRDKHEQDATNHLNKIGKLSAKKIQGYIDAIAYTYDTLTQLSKERVKAVEDFKNRLEGLPVHWWREGKRGSITKGGLIYEFSIEDNGYIKEEIKVNFTSSLASFLKMSDNKF